MACSVDRMATIVDDEDVKKHHSEKRSDVFDRIDRAYLPYLDRHDPLSFPMKIYSLSQNEYRFWRGTRDLFYQWVKEHVQDWDADPSALFPNHGDLHLGNIGTYVSEAGWGQLAFGMVDFDDSALLPLEVELMQGLVTLELVARENRIDMTDSQRSALYANAYESYLAAIESMKNATELLKDQPTVAKMLGKASKRTYERELEKFTESGRFRRVAGKNGAISDLLNPVETERWDGFAQALADAAANDSRLARLLRERDQASIRQRIKDIVRRTRLGSSGSQGLHKYFLLLDKPFTGIDHDVILYMKQEIPSAAERSGLSLPRHGQTPAERCALDMDRMTQPQAIFNSWCELDGRSYWVYLKEPWSDEIESDDIRDYDDLLGMTQVWATVVGCTHQQEKVGSWIRSRLTPSVRQTIARRVAAYLNYQASAFQSFARDARTRQIAKKTEVVIVQAGKHGCSEIGTFPSP